MSFLGLSFFAYLLGVGWILLFCLSFGLPQPLSFITRDYLTRGFFFCCIFFCFASTFLSFGLALFILINFCSLSAYQKGGPSAPKIIRTGTLPGLLSILLHLRLILILILILTSTLDFCCTL